jgi:hypothetical protein
MGLGPADGKGATDGGEHGEGGESGSDEDEEGGKGKLMMKKQPQIFLRRRWRWSGRDL